MKKKIFSWSVLLIFTALILAVAPSAQADGWYDLIFIAQENGEPIYAWYEDGWSCMNFTCYTDGNGAESSLEHKDNATMWYVEDDIKYLAWGERTCEAREIGVGKHFTMKIQGEEWDCYDATLDKYKDDQGELDEENNYENDNVWEVGAMFGWEVTFWIGIHNPLDEGTWTFENTVEGVPDGWSATFDQLTYADSQDIGSLQVVVSVPAVVVNWPIFYFTHYCADEPMFSQTTTVHWYLKMPPL